MYDSIGYTIKHLHKWAKPKKVRTPVVHFGSKSYIMPEPYGSVLIVGPFNYPFMLVIEPLVGAIMAGNAAVVKPSEFTPNVSKILVKLLGQFDNRLITVVEGAKEETSALIHAPFDLIFFTGSTQVGKIVMEAASHNLTPVVLELGGKSPCIVDKDANLDLAAERILWGKFLNTGQTCIAPDYILAHESIRESLVAKMKQKLVQFYGENPRESKDYGRIVNERQWDRLNSLIDSSKVVVGGQGEREQLYFAPTIMDGVTWEDKVMEEEIFGPILPIVDYKNLNEAISQIQNRPKPLALYLFTNNKQVQEQVLENTSFGGGCVNDTLLHLVTPHMPFGGVGSSGMGAYHGRYSFETFSHMKSVLKKSTAISLKMLYPPYSVKSMNLIKRFMK
ncbi:Aldehyde dehydrogenase [compost metagenome]